MYKLFISIRELMFRLLTQTRGQRVFPYYLREAGNSVFVCVNISASLLAELLEKLRMNIHEFLRRVVNSRNFYSWMSVTPPL